MLKDQKQDLLLIDLIKTTRTKHPLIKTTRCSACLVNHPTAWNLALIPNKGTRIDPVEHRNKTATDRNKQEQELWNKLSTNQKIFATKTDYELIHPTQVVGCFYRTKKPTFLILQQF